MGMFSRRRITMSIASMLLLMNFETTHAAAPTTNWLGITTAWNSPANWTAGIPTTADTAGFTGTTTPLNPQITDTRSVGEIQFLTAPRAYVFDIAIGGFLKLDPTVIGQVGVNNSVLGTAAVNQTFNVRDNGIIAFRQATSADYGSTGKVTYNIDSNTRTSFIEFEDTANAGMATINVGLVSVQPGNALNFIDSSDALSANINLYNGSVLLFDDTSTISAANITSDASTINFSSTALGTSTATVSIGNSSTINVNENTQLATLNSSSTGDVIDIDSGNTLTIGDASTGNVIAGKITGAGTLIKVGTGDVEITNSTNNFGALNVVAGTAIAQTGSINGITGTITTQVAGTLELNNTLDTPTLTKAINNLGTLEYTGTADATISGAITGNGDLVVNAPFGSLTLTNTTSTFSDIDVISGTLNTPIQIIAADTVIEPCGVLDITSSGTTTNNIVDNGTLIYSGVGTGTITGNISGNGQLIVDADQGTLVLTGTNTYECQTRVKDGTLIVHENALTFFGKKTVDPGAVLEFVYNTGGTFAGDIEDNGLILTAGSGNTTLSGDISGVGHFTAGTNPGQTFLRGNNTYSGGTDVTSNGRLTTYTQSLPTSGSRVINGPSGVLTIDNTIADNYPAPFLINGTMQAITTADVEFSGDLSGTGFFLADSANHTITLSGFNTYSGGTGIKLNSTLSAETHNLPAGRAITDDGVLLLTNKTFGVLTGTITGNGIVRYVGTSDAEINAVMSGSISLEMNAPDQRLILSGANTFNGGAFVNDGTLQVTTATLPSTGTNPDATVGPDGTLDFHNTVAGTYTGQIVDDGTVIVTSTANTTLSGVISGIGKVVVDTPTPGVVTTLSGPNTYLGGTIVEHGIAQARPVNLPVGAEANALIVRNNSEFNFIPNVASTFAGNILLEDLASNLRSAGPASLTITGAITGDGHVEVNGGNLTLTSAFNDYSGGTTVFAGNTLFGNTDALQGDIDVEGTVNFTQNIDGVFNGTVFSSAPGVGQVIKSGTGRMIVNTDSPNFQGITNVTDGIFDLNATWGGNVVASNAKLTGNSHYKGDVSVTNNSTISPGDDRVIGTIYIGGNYSQDATSTYLADLGAHGESDRIYVGENASLNGTIFFDVIDGTVSEKDTYLLMHIDGTLTGTFANVQSDNNLFKYFVTYRNNIGSFDVLLNAKSIFHLCDGFNGSQIGDQFFSIVTPCPLLQEIIEEIAFLAQEDDIDAICNAFEQMAGTQYLGMMVATELSGHKFLRQLYDPIRSIVTRTQPCRIYYDDPCCSKMCCEWHPTFSAWLEAGGGHTSISGGKGPRGLKFDSYNVTGGFQSSITSDWTVGLAGAYEHDDVSYHLGGNGVNRTGFIGTYGLYRPSCWYFFGDLAYGYSMNSVHRRIDLGDLHFAPKGTPKVHQVQTYIEAGFDVPFCKFLIQPFLGFEANFLRRSKLTEKGGCPLNLVLSEKERSNLYSRLGVHLTTDSMCSRYALSVDLAWQCRLNHLSDRAHERFQSFGNRFGVKGYDMTRNSFDGAATFTAFLGDNWELFVEVAGEKWSRTSTFDVTGGVKYSW